MGKTGNHTGHERPTTAPAIRCTLWLGPLWQSIHDVRAQDILAALAYRRPFVQSTVVEDQRISGGGRNRVVQNSAWHVEVCFAAFFHGAQVYHECQLALLGL